MGKMQKRKGYRVEHELVVKLKEMGLDAKRVPLSGATEFAKGDVVVNGLVLETKARKNGFKQLYDWIEGKDALAVKADRKEYLVVMRLDLFVKLLRGEKDDVPDPEGPARGTGQSS